MTMTELADPSVSMGQPGSQDSTRGGSSSAVFGAGFLSSSYGMRNKGHSQNLHVLERSGTINTPEVKVSSMTASLKSSSSPGVGTRDLPRHRENNHTSATKIKPKNRSFGSSIFKYFLCPVCTKGDAHRHRAKSMSETGSHSSFVSKSRGHSFDGTSPGTGSRRLKAALSYDDLRATTALEFRSAASIKRSSEEPLKAKVESGFLDRAFENASYIEDESILDNLDFTQELS
jgi:hypothetical protein